jgi:hypothetical protein
MKLSLGQKILVETTCGLGEFFTLHPTTVSDVQKRNNKEFIVLGNNNDWGAARTRSRNQVAATPQEIDAIISKQLANSKMPQIKDCVYTIKFDNYRFSIYKYRLVDKVESLSEGSYKLYTSTHMGGDHNLRVYGSNQPNVFYDYESALEGYKKACAERFFGTPINNTISEDDNDDEVSDDIKDVSLRITDKLVEMGFVPNCIDTNDETEFEVQDMIREEIKKYTDEFLK